MTPSSRFHQSTKCPISKTLNTSLCPKQLRPARRLLPEFTKKIFPATQSSSLGRTQEALFMKRTDSGDSGGFPVYFFRDDGGFARRDAKTAAATTRTISKPTIE